MPRPLTIALATIATLALVIIAACAVVIASPAPTTTPDITVLPCSAWAHTEYPTIPPYTFTGACSLPDGTLSLSPVN